VPLLRILVLALALAQATGLTQVLEVACDDVCADEDGDEGCPPVCVSCKCAPSTVGIATAPATVSTPMELAPPTVFARVGIGAPSPDPREILRVPIALLA
jgi:hypothetical protein